MLIIQRVDTSIIVCKIVRIALMSIRLYMCPYVNHTLFWYVPSPSKDNKEEAFLHFYAAFRMTTMLCTLISEFVLSKSHITPGCMQDASTLP